MDRQMNESLFRKTSMRLSYRGESRGREIRQDQPSWSDKENACLKHGKGLLFCLPAAVHFTFGLVSIVEKTSPRLVGTGLAMLLSLVCSTHFLTCSLCSLSFIWRQKVFFVLRNVSFSLCIPGVQHSFHLPLPAPTLRKVLFACC